MESNKIYFNGNFNLFEWEWNILNGNWLGKMKLKELECNGLKQIKWNEWDSGAKRAEEEWGVKLGGVKAVWVTDSGTRNEIRWSECHVSDGLLEWGVEWVVKAMWVTDIWNGECN